MGFAAGALEFEYAFFVRLLLLLFQKKSRESGKGCNITAVQKDMRVQNRWIAL